jgi:hypothetical protein
MSATQQSAERTALQGLLLLLVEVQNQAGLPDFAEVGEETTARLDAARQIEQLVNSPHASEMIQLARAALGSTSRSSTVNRFFAIVCEQDLPKEHRAAATAEGPIMMETMLNAFHTDRAWVENKAKAFTHYGWVRVAEVLVDIPEQPRAAIPAAAAAVHE